MKNKDKKQKKMMLAVVVLVIGVFWLLSDFGFITANIPWLSLVMIVVSLAWIISGVKDKKKFPTFGIIVFLLGMTWLLNEMEVLTLNIPWFPLIMVIVAIGWIVDNYMSK